MSKKEHTLLILALLTVSVLFPAVPFVLAYVGN